MRSIIVFLCIVTFFDVHLAQGQDSAGYQIGILPLSWESTDKTANLRSLWIPSFTFYLTEDHNSTKWVNYVEAGYAYLKVNDDCDCADHFYGIGEFQELKVILAKRYIFGLRKGWRWSPFVQAGIYTSYSTYSGDFSGGISGKGTSFNVRNISAGIHAKTGLQYHLSDFWLLSLQASIHYGYYNDHAQNSPGAFAIGLIDIGASFLQFGIGYRF